MSIPLRNKLKAAAGAALLAITFYGCKHEASHYAALDDGGYPAAVNRIMMLHCTTGPTGGGCHNEIGADYANGLRLDTWDRLFDGGNHGASVIPYDTANSTLLHYINTDSSQGAIALPQMPYTGSNYSSTPLSRDEYNTIRDWIAAGAPDKNGVIPFTDNADTRQKVYVTEQGSDILSIVDAGRNVIMRNIRIGKTTLIEGPHCVRVSKDGRYAYVAFQHGDWVQKIDAKTDQIVGEVNLNSDGSNGSASWNILHVSDDGSKFIIADFNSGLLIIVNTATMQIEQNIRSGISSPHGMASSHSFDTIYIAAQYGNTVYKLMLSQSFFQKISIDGEALNVSQGKRDPHEILFTPDRSKYFLACEFSNEVRVLNTVTDTIMAAIPVPQKPQELAVSRTKPYMIVTCMEAASPIQGALGAVVVINYETMQIVKTIWGPFWQPHGIAIDDVAGKFYISSTNQTGPSTGHNHDAGGKHGWINVYDLATLELSTPMQNETLILPYSADIRLR